MAKKWPGGIITKNQATPTGPYQDGTAPGIWTLNQMSYWVKQALWPTAGNVNPSAFIENLFSTYLYTGNGSTQTITNGIDLSGKGGLVWIKPRQSASTKSHSFWDTIRGVGTYISSNLTNGNVSEANGLTAFSSNGFSVGINTGVNESTYPIVSWTFREQPKFFDIVTYTGTGANTTIAHNLGSIPGCIIVKRTDTTGAWQVYHRSLANTQYMVLNTTAAVATGATRWNSTTPTSSVFSLGTDTTVNASGGTYVAYLFAHNAGGFGLSGTENVISCGSYTGNGSTSGPVTTLGYEPQWILIKNASATTGGWVIVDNMRGLPVGGNSNVLRANVSGAESTSVGGLTVTATGFQQHDTDPNFNESGNLYIYIAIRRPMKTPTTGTEVFSPVARNGTGATATITSGFVTDLVVAKERNDNNLTPFFDRLRGALNGLSSTNTEVENETGFTYPNSLTSFSVMNGVTVGIDNEGYTINRLPDAGPSFYTYINYLFKRAPGFFDVVCYTGTGSLPGVTHNLGVTPELKIIKRRNFATNWVTGGSIIGENGYLFLNTTAALTSSSNYWDGGDDSATVFSVRNTNSMSDSSGGTYVAYLFATVAGVSKVGSYTGNGSSQTINCGFTTGARFFLVKATSTTGNWWVYDSARGIISSNDPALALNSTAAEVTSADAVDADSSGIIVNQEATCSINASGVSYIFLSIA